MQGSERTTRFFFHEKVYRCVIVGNVVQFRAMRAVADGFIHNLVAVRIAEVGEIVFLGVGTGKFEGAIVVPATTVLSVSLRQTLVISLSLTPNPFLVKNIFQP